MSNKSQLQENNSLLNTILGIVSNKQNKEVTAGTEAKIVERTDGGILWTVKVHPTPSQSKTVTPSESKQTVVPYDGMLLSSVDVEAIPSDYLDMASATGFAKFATGSFTLASDTAYGSNVLEITHNMGVVPKVLILLTPESVDSKYRAKGLIGFAPSETTEKNRMYLFAVYNNYSDGYEVYNESLKLTNFAASCDAEKITAPHHTSSSDGGIYLMGGKTYYWIALA